MSHSSTATDARGYYVIINLCSERPLTERARVYGPMWHVTGDRSTLNLVDGPIFTKADAEATRATPICHFDAGGHPVSADRRPGTKALSR